MTDTSREDQNPFDDVIIEAINIGKYIYKSEIDMADDDAERDKLIKQAQRSVYHLVETSRLPVFRLGSRIAARRSALKEYVEKQERMTSRKTKGFKDPEDGDK